MRRLIAAALAAVLIAETPGPSCFAAIGELKARAVGHSSKAVSISVEDVSFSAGDLSGDALPEELRTLELAPLPGYETLKIDRVEGPGLRIAGTIAPREEGRLSRQLTPVVGRRFEELSFAFQSRVSEEGPAEAPAHSRFRWTHAVALAGMIGAAAASPAAGQNKKAVPSPIIAATPVIQQGDLEIALKIDPKPHAFGDPVRVRLIVKNKSLTPIPVGSPKQALERAVASYFKVSQGPTGEFLIPAAKRGPKGLVPTEVPFDFELQTITIPRSLAPGGTITIPILGRTVAASGGELTIPGFDITLRSLVGPDAVPELRNTEPDGPYALDLRLLAGWAALLGTLIGLGIWAARKLSRKPAPALEGIQAITEDEVLIALRRLRPLVVEGKVEQTDFYGRLNVLIVNSLGPRYGMSLAPDVDLRKNSATLRQLVRRVDAEGRLWIEIAKGLAAINGNAEAALYAEAALAKETLLGDLDRAEYLYKRYRQLKNIDALHGKMAAGSIAPKGSKALGLLPFPLFLDFEWQSFAIGRPILLAILAGLIALTAWRSWRSRPAAPAPLPNSRWLLKRRSWGQRLQSFGNGVFFAGILSAAISASDPMWGYHQLKRTVSSLDTYFVVDGSGSMGGKLRGSWITKMQGAVRGGRFLINRQRGTTNRVGIIVFTESSRVLQTLTIDYDAADQVMSQIRDGGGTEIGPAIDEAINNFLETNIIDADPEKYPGATKIKKILKEKGLSAALEEAAKDPSLLEIILAKDRPKGILLLTDGDSKTKSLDAPAAGRAARMGFVIFSIGVPSDDGSGYDERALRMFAAMTKDNLPKEVREVSTFFPVTDAAGLDRAFRVIDSLQKAMVKAHGLPRPIHRDKEFAQLAWWLIVIGMLLKFKAWARVRQLIRLLRARYGLSASAILLAAALIQSPQDAKAGMVWDIDGPAPAASASKAPKTAAPSGASVPEETKPAELKGKPAEFSPRDLLPYREIPEIREANELYRQKKYAEAEQRYNQAIKDSPGFVEARIYRGMSLLQQKKLMEAKIALEEALKLAQDQKRPDAIAEAELQLGNVSAALGDDDGAMQHYHQSTRQQAADGSGDAKRLARTQEVARWNYEALLTQKGLRSELEQLLQQGEGPNEQGEPQKGERKQEKKRQGQGEDGQGQPPTGQKKEDKGQGAAKKKAEPKDGKGSTPAEQEAQRLEKQLQDALKELGERAKKNDPGGGAGSRQKRGFAWALLAGIPVLGALLSPDRAHAGPLEQLDRAVEWARNVDWDFAANFNFDWVFQLGGLWWLDTSFLTATLLLAPFLLWAGYAHAKSIFDGLRRFAPRMVPERFEAWTPGQRLTTEATLATVGLVALSLAAIAPVIGSLDQKFSMGGRDIVMEVGVGWREVLAEDKSFDQETSEIERFLHWLENGSAVDRVALLPYAGNAGDGGLTYDYRNHVIGLYHLKRDAFFLREGSDLSAAVDKMIRVFDTAKDAGTRPRVGILIGAGGDLTVAQAEAAAAKAKRHDIIIYTLGVGSLNGNLMMIPPEWRERFVATGSGYIEQGGVPVRVHVNVPALRALAENTGGTFGFAEKGQGVDSIMAQVAGMEKEKQTNRVSVDQTLSHGFSLAAFGFLILSVWVGTRKRASRTLGWLKKIWERPWRARGKGPLLSFAPLALLAVSGAGPLFVALALILGLAVAGVWLAWPAKGDAPAGDAHGLRSQEVQRRFEQIRLAAREISGVARQGGEFKSKLLSLSGWERAESVPSQGEDYRNFDHRTSARLGADYYKRREFEPDPDMIIVLNRRKASGYGSRNARKWDVEADLAAALALAAAAESIPVGLAIVSDRIEKLVEPGRGRDHAEGIARIALHREPSGRKTELGAVLKQLARRFPNATLFPVISDFDEPGYEDGLRRLRKAKHLAFPLVVQDVLETGPVREDFGELDVEDPESGRRGAVDFGSAANRKELSAVNERHRAATEAAMSAAGLRALFLTNDGRHLKQLVAYFTGGRRK